MTTGLSGTLRLVTALSLVLAVGWTGFVHRSPWAVLPLSLAFTVLYVAGKWRAWKAAVRLGGWRTVPVNLAQTWPVQIVVAGVVYLIGFGLGALLTDRAVADGLAPFDWWLAAILVALAIPLTVLIEWLETRAGTADGAADTGNGSIDEVEAIIRRNETARAGTPERSEEFRIEIDPTPTTLDTFYSRRTSPDRIAPPASEQEINEAERRLGVELPETLRELYRRRNGGDTHAVWVARVPDPEPFFSDWRACFGHDYDWLLPLDKLRTLRDAYLDWVDEDDPDGEIPANAEKYVVLAMRYQDTTFLDYSRPGPPRVGVVDFERPGREDVWFETFDEFFAALREETEWE